MENLEQIYEEAEALREKGEHAAAIEKYRYAAERGYADASDTMAYLYYIGEGVEEDLAESEKWHREAFSQYEAKANDGNFQAQVKLVIYYSKGTGVKRDLAKAEEWYKAAKNSWKKSFVKSAAKLYLQLAENSLKPLRKSYDPDSYDYPAAAEILRQPAEQGQARAQFYLGNCYRNGIGVNENLDEAIKWYKKAAEQGYTNAQDQLGDMYLYGKGVEKDEDEAQRWYKTAFLRAEEQARKGIFKYQIKLMIYYMKGRGVEKNVDKAEEWYNKATTSWKGDPEYGDGKKAKELLSGYKPLLKYARNNDVNDLI